MSSPSYSVKSKVTLTSTQGGAKVIPGFDESDSSVDPMKAKIMDL